MAAGLIHYNGFLTKLERCQSPPPHGAHITDMDSVVTVKVLILQPWCNSTPVGPGACAAWCA